MERLQFPLSKSVVILYAFLKGGGGNVLWKEPWKPESNGVHNLKLHCLICLWEDTLFLIKNILWKVREIIKEQKLQPW